MSRSTWLVVLGGFVACERGDTVTKPITETGITGDDDDDVVVVTGDDEGSVILVVQQPSAVDPVGNTSLTALFVQDTLGWVNLAECFTTFCTNQWPTAPGESIAVQGPDVSLADDLATVDLGRELSLGPLRARRQADGDFEYYAEYRPRVEDLGAQPLGLTYEDGAWGDYDGSGDVASPTPMVVTVPSTTEVVEFVSSDLVALRWEPGSSGDVYLLVTSQTERRLHWLEDTGAYDLDLSGLGLPDTANVQLDLGRWSFDGVDQRGNVANIVVKSNQHIEGVWRDIGARTALTALYDTCAEARVGTAAVSGNYYGDFRDFANDLRPQARTCTPWTATGQDAIVPLDLLPDDQVDVSYRLPSGDASLYVTTDCADLGECFEGRDSGLVGATESFTFVNGAQNARVYLVMDGFSSFQSDFTLDLEINSLTSNAFVPTCAEAIAQGPVAPDSYQGRLGGNANLLQPDCSPNGTGGEGVLQVFLLPGQTLDATVTTNGSPNAALYLLYNCSIGDSCLDIPPSKHLVYRNETAFTEFLYLVLDGPPGLDNYVLDLQIL